MLEDGATDRYEAVDGDGTFDGTPAADADDVFTEFVRKANGVGPQPRTLEGDADAGALSRDGSDARRARRHPPPTQRHVAAWRGPTRDVRSLRPRSAKGHADTRPERPLRPDGSIPRAPKRREPALGVDEPTWGHRPGLDTQRREALLVVPSVADVRPPSPPVPERSESGHIPAGELDRILGDMSVLLRYGHHADVRRHFDALLARYPEDLLLRRRVAEFHLQAGDFERAREALFALSAALFERGNIQGVRDALQQVLVIEPHNARAARLLALLDRRRRARRSN